MNSPTRRLVWGLGFAATFAAIAAPAQMMQNHDDSPLRRLSISKAALNPPAASVLFDEVRSSLAPAVQDAWDRFTSEAGGTWVGYADKRSGALSYAEGSGWPWIPGSGNQLVESDLAAPLGPNGEVTVATMESIARGFLPKVAPLLGVDPRDLKLSLARTSQVADYLWYVEFDVFRGGFQIDGARVLFRVNHGNLVQFGTEGVPPQNVAVPQPSLTRDQAQAAVASYVGGFTSEDTLVDAGTLKLATQAVIVPGAADFFDFAEGYGLLPVWELSFRRKNVLGTWRARVDARTGEVIEFVDANEYAQATGGVVLVQPSLGETAEPMPFTNVSTGGFTNSAGIYTFQGVPTTSSLNGQYVRANDSCGGISLADSGAGAINFGNSPASDCSTPGFGGTGNTRSSRTQFYWVNRVKEVGRGWLPAAWLSAQLTANVNLNQVCNAYWNGSTLNFFKSGGGCGNTGELPSVSLHEYGHGLDSNDGTGSPPENGSGETVGDWTASLAVHLSCIGSGFLGGNCGGYGNGCTACTGVRDIDWAKHVANTPSTVQNFTQTTCPQPSANNPNYVGPCGRHAISTGITTNKREGHCESYISSQSLWDLANRDLPSPGSGGAWSISDRLWYLTRATTTSFFTCTTGAGTWASDGCAAGTLFRTFRVADDDDGNLANGTPHGGAIFAAFNRHNIACASDPGSNTTFAACTIPASPAVTLTPGNNQMQVDWTSSGPGVVYDVYRNEAGCNAGFTKIANDTSSLTLNDNAVANGGTYYYQVIAQPTGSEACGAPPSNCASSQPVPCTTPNVPLIGAATPQGPNQIQVSWTNGSPPASNFNIYRAHGTCASPTTPFTEVAAGVTGTSFLDTLASGGVPYAYKITGTDPTGVCESPQTTCVEAITTGGCVDAPSFAGLASAGNAGASTCGINLSWTGASPFCSGPVTYNVYRSTNPTFTPAPANLVVGGVSSTSYTDSSPLTPSTAYTYVVRAVDSSNGAEENNVVRKSATPTGPNVVSTLTDTFEAAGGFDLPGWTHSIALGTTDWALSTSQSQTPTHSWFSAESAVPGERVLISPPFQAVATTTLSFFHTFAFEFSSGTCWDGGTIEYTTDNGVNWTVMPDANFTAGGFTGTINAGNPIGAKRGYCAGTIGAMTQVSINLGSFAGQTLRIRWREGDDDSVAATGWFVDSVVLTDAQTPAVCSAGDANSFNYFTVTPCRLLDTRNPSGPVGGPVIGPSSTRTFAASGLCNIPASAKALSVNVTVVSPAAAGDLRIYPSDLPVPLTSTINFGAGQTRTNNAIITLPADGSQAIQVFNESTGATNVILDVNGLFQ